MEIGRFANAAVCLLVAEEKIHYLANSFAVL